MNRCCPNAVKESRSERVGFYRDAQGGVACLTLLKISMSLHRWQRSQRRNHRLWEGTLPTKQERNTFNAMQQTWCMIWHVKALNWPNAIDSHITWSGIQIYTKFQLQHYLLNYPNHKMSYLVMLSCWNMHDRGINRFIWFSDHFSYINYFHPSYRLFSMIFRSFKHFLNI